MKLHSPAFEKALKRKIRITLRGSSALMREFRGARKVRRHYPQRILVRPIVSIGFAFMVWLVQNQTHNFAPALAVINLWAFTFVFAHAQGLLSRLYASADLNALALLPVNNPTIFRWELQKFFRVAFWSLLDLLAGFTALALIAELSWTGFCLALGIAVVVWIEVIALAAFCVSRRPGLPYWLVAAGLIALLVALLLLRDLVGSAAIELLNRYAPGLNLMLPTGWPVSLFEVLLPGRNWSVMALLLPTVLIIGTLKSSMTRLGKFYRFHEHAIREAPDILPDGDGDSDVATATTSARVHRVGPTAIEEIVMSRRFFNSLSWNDRGWQERLLWRWLNTRERVLVEFTFPGGLNLSAAWKKIFRNLAIASVAGIAAGFVDPTLQNWILGAGLFVTIIHVFASMNTSGRAFQLIRCSGVNIPYYAVYAIGFREMSATLLKVSLVQFPLLTAFSIAWSALIFYVGHWPLLSGLLFGFKAAGLLMVCRFMGVVGSFSSGTNDTSTIRFQSAFLLLMVAGFGLTFLGFGGASLFVPNSLIAWVFWFLALLDACIFFAIYRWYYLHARFDLMSLPKN